MKNNLWPLSIRLWYGQKTDRRGQSILTLNDVVARKQLLALHEPVRAEDDQLEPNVEQVDEEQEHGSQSDHRSGRD